MVLVAEAFIVAAVGWFVSPHITKLMEVARSCASSMCGKLSKGTKEKLQRLAQDLEDIKGFLDPDNMGFVNGQTRLDRLWRLKDAIHDAEEILDLFQLEIHEAETAKVNTNNLGKKKTKKMKMKRQSGAGSSKSAGIAAAGTSSKASLDQLDKVLKNLDELRGRAQELYRDSHRGASSILKREETGPNPAKDQKSFFGYQDEYTQLVSMLQKDGKLQEQEKKVIAIVGHAGMGKTELARQAYRDVQEKFDLRIWVHAYDKNTEFDLLKEIWKSAAGDKPVGKMNVSSLQTELGKLLMSKRCLLVLDDVWNHESATTATARKQARVALDSFARFAGHGSRIVLTTRAKICATTLGAADAPIVLNGIKPKEMTLLINETANLIGTTGDPRSQELLHKQVHKLKGSPLAAVDIGDELKEQRARASLRRCSDILNNIDHNIGSVISGHLFTYRHLPPHLQRCFSFCSIFPYGCRLEIEKLTRMWIAHGFVEDTESCPGGNNSMEDIARGYFNSLVDRSLFQREDNSNRGGSGDKDKDDTAYVIHEHIHQMIRRASAKNCMSISRTSVPRSIPVTVRHLSVTSGFLDQLKAYSTTLSNLRTLLVLKDDDDNGPSTSNPLVAIDKSVLTQFKGVRVLDLSETGLTQLPASINKLKHVRYLGLPSTMTDLCDQVTGLLFLQTFSFKEGNRQCKFPDDMSRLINMRHLDIHTECISTISRIGSLVKLQGPLEFRMIKGSEKEGHAMSELAGMSSLGGTLSIKGLEAVESKEEAEQARLASKGSVKVLKLEWAPLQAKLQCQVNEVPSAAGSSAAAPLAASADIAAAVLEGLRPHPDLRGLHITRYPGVTWPSWLGALEKLTRLYLRNCRKMKCLPALGGLPCLELLDIKELTIVERIDSGFCGGGGGGRGAFPKLKKLLLDDMPRLVAWDDAPKQAFSRLEEVSIADCPLVSSLSALGSCIGPIHLRVKGRTAIREDALPANFTDGDSTCVFE